MNLFLIILNAALAYVSLIMMMTYLLTGNMVMTVCWFAAMAINAHAAARRWEHSVDL